ncbi:hypothetical protein Y032_1096g3596 [Ancylostoma ceylanicum]|uniref:Reverse transcriptase domain-containing protein n=1 Tax=Ancylostoma ceylanicum TaxID=53326 RepID=A0A016W5Z3_9BILA|nr:hypothetical protein Y032_1096g3596 [Ancylostoma ceylanicum]
MVDQFGFVPERSTIDGVIIARQVMEKYGEKNEPCHLAPLDDERKRHSESMVRTVQVMYGGSTARVRTSHGITSKIDITVGEHQESASALSPFLFNMTLDTVS